MHSFLIPHFVGILIVCLADRDDGIVLVDGANREKFSVLREQIRFSTDSTTEDIGVILHNAHRVGLKRVGRKMLLKKRGVDIGRNLYRLQIVAHMLNRCLENTIRALDGRLSDQISRLKIENAQRQHKQGCCHQHDVEAELSGESTADLTHGRPPFLS